MRPADALSGCVESSNEEAERKAIVCPCSHPTCRVEKLLAHHAEQTSRRGLLRQVSRTTSLWAAEWQHDLSASHVSSATYSSSKATFPTTRAAYRTALAIAERLAMADPGNAGWWQREVMRRLGWRKSQSGWQIAHRRSQICVVGRSMDRLAKGDPGNAR